MIPPYQKEQSPRLEVVARRPDQAIVRALKSLLAEAESGQVVGLLAAAHYGGPEFSYAGVGSVCANPALGLGATLRLAQKLL